MKRTQDIFEKMNTLIGTDTPNVTVAVSGGADSMALLDLTRRWAQKHNISVCAITVDHALRNTSAQEAKNVAAWCLRNNIEHQTFLWDPTTSTGNLSEDARNARLSFFAQFLNTKPENARTIILGHSKTDQAETLVMNLMRGSGSTGLAAMPETRTTTINDTKITLCRPALTLWDREELRTYCHDNLIPFFDDPTNDNEAYERVRVRKCIETLGMDVDRLVKTASRMQRVDKALEQQTQYWAPIVIKNMPDNQKFITIDFSNNASFLSVPEEIQLRLLAKTLQSVNPKNKKPREKSLLFALEAIKNHKGTTLQGCKLIYKEKQKGFLVTIENRNTD